MLVKFTCEAYSNLTYFGDVAQRLLAMMGQSVHVPGVIMAEAVPAALEHLQSAIKQEIEMPSEQDIKIKTSNAFVDEDEQPVSLEHRAAPLIELLTAAAQKKCYVMWDKC